MRRAAGALRPRTEAQSRWPAPAKLNLFLHVTGRRADGYHELQTLFQLIDLTDDISPARARRMAPSSGRQGLPGSPPRRT